MYAQTTSTILREQVKIKLVLSFILIERQIQINISITTLINAYKQMGVGFFKVLSCWKGENWRHRCGESGSYSAGR